MKNLLNPLLKGDMTKCFLRLAGTGIVVILISTACGLKATPPPVDVMGTEIALGVSAARTLTAGAPTPLPTATATQTPIPATDTPYIIVIKEPVVRNFAACWFGPGPAYNLESNISKGETVELVGVGSVPGWYIIINPYFHQPCWIQADDLILDPALTPSMYPMITPYPTRIPKTAEP